MAYNLLLMRCHRLGEFGQACPLARGTSPWLAALAIYTTVDGLGARSAGAVDGCTGW